MHTLDKKYKVHIVILTKNTHELLTQCLDSIIDKRYHEPNTFLNYSIYIGDTGSSDFNKEKIRAYIKKNLTTNINYIHFDGYNFAKVNNHIIQNELVKEKGKKDLILFCNNDIKLLSDCVTEFVECYHKNKNVGTVGCKLLFGNKTIQHAGQIVFESSDDPEQLAVSHRGLGAVHDAFSNRDLVYGNTAALMLTSKQVFDKIGPLSTECTSCFEDMIYNIECTLAGKENHYLGDVVAYHYEHITSDTEGTQEKRRKAAGEDWTNVLSPFLQKHYEFLRDKKDTLSTISVKEVVEA